MRVARRRPAPGRLRWCRTLVPIPSIVRAHRVQQAAEVLDMGLAGGVPDHRPPLGQ